MKIALLGSAPSSRDLAPFSDSSWEIWTCSPSNMELPRSDVFFEIHAMDWMERDVTLREFLSWLTKHPRVYLQQQDSRFPTSVTFPKEAMIAEFGPYFFSSSIAWMMALAMTKKPEAIGLFGVDMTATEEYGHQRTGCQYFIQMARNRGIQIVVPIESDICVPAPMYAYREADPMWRKLKIRREEMTARLSEAQHKKRLAQEDELALSGALEDVEYMIQTWPGNRLSVQQGREIASEPNLKVVES